jgi:RNA polymerase sigma factor for flagellar operon FliA
VSNNLSQVAIQTESKIIDSQQLAQKYMPFAEAIVTKLCKVMSLPLYLKDEFKSAAYFGLVEAANRYDFSQGIPFERFAYIRIRGAIIDYIRSCSDMNVAAYKLGQRLNAQDQSVSVGGQNLSAIQEQVTTNANTSNKNIGSYLVRRVSVDNLEEEFFEIEKTPSNPESVLNQKQQSAELWKKVQSLPIEQSQILESFYLHEISFTDIAHNQSGCSKSWVSRLHQRALDNLKHKIQQAESVVKHD